MQIEATYPENMPQTQNGFSKTSPTVSFSPEFTVTQDKTETAQIYTRRSESQSISDKTGSLRRSNSTERFLGSLSQDLSGSVLVFDDYGSVQSLANQSVLQFDQTSHHLKAVDIQPILRLNLANLIGAEDYAGCPVVTVPNRVTKQEFSTNQNALLETLLYFSAILKPENKSKGYTVIVDTRGTFGKAVKPFARFFAAVPDQSFTTKQIVFVKSDDFIEKQIANLRIRTKKNREVPVHFVSSKKLDKLVDRNQLPSELGGSINYNHRMWINNRVDYETFVQTAEAILQSGQPVAGTPNDSSGIGDLAPKEVNVAAVKDCYAKGEELVKRLVNLPDPKSLHTYQPESTDQRDMRIVVESYLGRLSTVKTETGSADEHDSGGISGKSGLLALEKDPQNGAKMSQKREMLEKLIQDAIQFIDWSRNEGGRLFAGVLDEIGKDDSETKTLQVQNDALIRSCQKHFEWFSQMTATCTQLRQDGYRVDKVEQISADLDTAFTQTLSKAQSREKLLQFRMDYHNMMRTVEQNFQSLEDFLQNQPTEESSFDDLQQLLLNSDQFCSQVEKSFMQLENIGDAVLTILGNLKEQSTETATSRNMVKDSLMSATDSREKIMQSHQLWKDRVMQYIELTGHEDNVRRITSEIAESFGYLAQTLQEDIMNGTSNFRSSFSVREPATREMYTEGIEHLNRVSLIRTDLALSEEPTNDLRDELSATWQNFFVQFAENGNEDHVLEICWLIMVQNWKLVEKLFKELQSLVSGSDIDQEQLRVVLNRNFEFRNYVEVSYEQTEILTTTFLERMAQNQTNGMMFSNEELIKLKGQLESLGEMKRFIDESYSGFVSQREAYSFFQIMIEACDLVRIRITEMVPGMLEIGSTLIEALDLYQVHQQFMEKIENRHDEIREVLRKADTMVESTDESQSQVYQAMAISLKDAWKELMMRMEERRILLELVIDFYRSCEEFGQHLDYAYTVCQSTLIADNIEQVQVLIEEHQEMKRATSEHSMNTIQNGQGLLDKIVEIGRNLESQGSNVAVSSSALVERVLAELHDRRTLLEELWLQRKIRLEQSLLIFQLDAEIQQITNWFVTVGSDNMHHTDLGNNPTETDKLIQIHLEFSNEAKVIEARITRVLRSVDTLILTGHEDGDNIRERVSEIEGLNRDILNKIESRRKRLMLTIDFWNSASVAFDRLVEIEEQIEETLSVPDGPSLGSNWKPERLAKLAQAILESTTPAIREGHIILDASSVGADGIKYIVEKLKERCAHLSSVCSEIRSERSSLYVMYDDKFSVVTTWLVNIGLDLLNRRRTLGTTRQSASDFFDDHSRLRDDLKTRFIDVEACGSIVESMEINQESGANEARLKVEELKQRWRTLAMFTEQRISLSETYLEFLNQSTEMMNLMDTLEELLKLDNWNLDSRTLESTRRIWLDKFRLMNEVYEQVYFKGRCFLKDSNTQTLNDKQLSVETTIQFVQKQLDLFEERRRVINDLWDTWKLKMPFVRDITSQWDMFGHDANKSLNWIVEVQRRLFAPLVIGDPKHCRQTAYVMKDRLAEIKITYKRVTSEVERWLKMSEMLNIKQKPESTSSDKNSEGLSPNSETESVVKIPQQLISEHKSYQTKMQIYDNHLNTLVEFLLKLGDLYDAIDATYSEVEKAKSTEDPEFVIKVMQVLDDTRDNEVQLFDDTVKSGNSFMDQVNDDELPQPAKKETKVILSDLDMDHQHWLQWYEQCSKELQSRIQTATHSNRAIYILQCIDQFRNELQDMEGVYGDGTEGLLQIVKNFELWLQDLDNFESKDIDPFLESMQSSNAPADNSNADRCEQKWNELQKAIGKHRSLLELAREYHVLLDEVESMSLECRDKVLEVSRKTLDADNLDKTNKLVNDLDKCEDKVEKQFISKLDRVYELAKLLFDPPPKYLDNLITRKNELKDSIETVRDELNLKQDQFTFDDEVEKVIEVGVNSQPLLMSSLPPVPPKTPPRIISGLEDATVPKGKSAVFDCTVIGSPTIRVTWQKDGKRLIDSQNNRISSDGAHKHTLEIPKVAADDTGTITLVAENDFGKTNSSAYLHVQGPQGQAPAIYKIPESLPKVNEGGILKLEAVVSGTPPPEVVWYRNGRELTPNEKVKIRSAPEVDEGLHQLVISDCTRADAGDYSVSATNDIGQVTKTCKVQVGEKPRPPKFVSELQDVEVEDGKPLRWEVEVDGKPTPVVKWFRGKEDMSNFDCEIEHVGPVCALVLDETFPDDEGQYTVVATNEQGSAQSEGFLTVKDPRIRKISVVGEPPKFVKKPADKEVAEGKSVEFTCKVTGNPLPEVKWVNKEGEELTQNDDFKLSYKNGVATLLIKEVIPDDDGKFLCKAVNRVGETTCSFFVKVLRKSKPFFEVPIKDVSCRELDSCSFDCVVSGDPKPTVHWQHNGEKIMPNNKEIKIIATGNKHSLHIKETQFTDRGTYKAIASNSEGEEGCSAFLAVEELPFHLKPHSPQIEKQAPAQIQAEEGEPVVIECDISAKPNPEVCWYKDRKHKLKPGPDIKMTTNGNTHSLQIRSCLAEDSGSYTLQAKNNLGEVSTSCNLYVKDRHTEPEAPEFVIGLSEVVAKEGESATFECVVKGVPAPTVSWYLNGEKLTEAPDQQIRRNEDKHLLKLHKLEIDDTGPLTATASNIAGNVSSTAPLLVNAREKKPILIQPLTSVKTKLGEPEAVMQCKIGNASAPPGCNINLYKDDQLVPVNNTRVKLIDDGQDSLKVVITNVAAEDEGQYCVEVSNGAGTVTTSAFCHIQEDSLSDQLADETDLVSSSANNASLLKGANSSSTLLDMYENVEVFLPIHEVANKYGSSKNVFKSTEDVITKTSTLLIESSNMEAPAFISELLQPPVVKVGQDVTLEIIVKGVPDPEVRWLKDDEPVDLKRCQVSRDDGKCTLQLKQVNPSDEGEFSIVAENPAGRAQCTCQLLIDDSSNAPIFTERLTTQEIEQGQPLELQVTVRAHPEPKVTWYLNDEPFKPSVGDSVCQEGPRYKCSIKSVTPEMSGKIAVVAENDRGKATSSAELIVTAPQIAPTFEKKLDGHVIKQNEPLHFHCVISGQPTPQVVWSLNGVIVQIDGHRITERRIGINYYLVINDVGPQDAGIYSCTAENGVGKAVSTAEVFVDVGDTSESPPGPSFPKPLTPTSLSEGAQLMLLCKVDPKAAPMDLFWCRDGEPINPEDERVIVEVSDDWWVRLLIDEVEQSDAGLYSCVAVNETSRTTTEAKVQVIARKKPPATPKIKQTLPERDESNPLETRVGEELRLKIILDDVDYSDASEVRWYKGSQLITQDHRTKIFREDREHTLVILNVEAEDSGHYSVSAINPSTGHSSTSTCFVLVKVPPTEVPVISIDAGTVYAPQFASSLENVTVYVDDRVELICHVSGYPLPTVYWTKDHQPLKLNPPRVFSDGGDYTYRLVIGRVCLEDQGLYICHAQNEGGQAESSCFMNVLPYEAMYASTCPVPTYPYGGYGSTSRPTTPGSTATSPRPNTNTQNPPRFLRQLEDLKIDEKEDIALFVELEHACDVSWLKDNKPLTEKDGFKFESDQGRHYLSLKHAEAKDSGIYSLKAQARGSKKSSSTTNCNVVVQALREAPLIRKRLSDKKVSQGQQVVFEAEVTGKPTPKVTWRREGTKITPSSKEFQISQRDQKHQLTIHEVYPEDKGTFTIVAENAVGRDTSSAVLKVVDQSELEEESPVILNLNSVLQSQPPSSLKSPGGKMSIQIVKALEPLTVLEGNPAALQCELGGMYNDQLVVSWEKDGICVDKDPNYSFSFGNNVARCFISECFPEDSGSWSVTFNHPSGQPEDAVTSTTELTCKEAVIIDKDARSLDPAMPESVAPEFIRKLTPQRLVEGGHAMFQCVVSGFPYPDIQWLKNNQIIQSGYRYQVQNDAQSGTCSLSISFILPEEDGGVYTCVATNVKGQAVTEAHLLDDDAYKRYLAEDQKRMFVGELTTKVRAKSPAMHRKDQRRDVYIPKYELNLARNVSDRLGSPLGPPGSHGGSSQQLPHPSVFNKPVDTSNFNAHNFEDRLLNEIEFRDEKLRAAMPPGQQDDNAGNPEVDISSIPESEIVPPTFATKPQTQKLIEGSTVRFECMVFGNPTPRFNWFHNGRPLYPSQRVSLARGIRDPESGTTKAALTLSRVYGEDSGYFTVLAWNPRGRTVCSPQLFVDRVGGGGGTGPASVTTTVMMKPGIMSAPEEPTQQQPQQQPPDYGRAQAFKMLEDRNKKMDAPVVRAGVYEKHLAPSFMKKPTDVFAKEGKTARFDCKVAGRPTPTLRWFHEGVEIPTNDPGRSNTVREDGTNSLLFHNVRARESGHYECVAQNKGGEARFLVRLIVDESSIEEPPRIIEKPPSNIPTREGDPITLRVRAIGHPEPQIAFVKDGRKDPYSSPAGMFDNPMMPQERPVIDKVAPGIFEISFPGGVNKDDNGWYTCSATSPAGVDSFSCKINIKMPNVPEPKPNPVKISIPKRGTHPLPPLPPPEEKPSWAKKDGDWDGTELYVPSKTQQPPKSKKLLPLPDTNTEEEVQPSWAKKDEWDESELYASSKTQQPPKFKKMLQDMNIAEGNKTYMECTVYPAGDPTMVVEWFKDGRPLLHGTRFRPIFEFGFCVLEFDNVWSRDAGTYVCRAVNKVGMAEVSCRVSVRGGSTLVDEDSQLPEDMRAGFEQLNQWEQIKSSMPSGNLGINEDEGISPPMIVQYPENVEVTEGQTAKFLCRVGGNPIPTVFWYRNEQIINASNRMNVSYDGIHRLEISKTRPSDSGLITLIARNHYGEARFDTNLVVKSKSGVAGQPSRVTNKNESVVMKKFVSNSVTTTVNTATADNTSTSINQSNGYVQTGIQL
ncbi:muscle M-line assembly protein unc-89-like isoform X3 [Convolutriloba macropyga]|uniref:muscle M-line assembly protein unc-89-like isoform X3 n=1 Tax=Convolutriloba macropyga TaxID=536237 RepID=UPI003F525665